MKLLADNAPKAMKEQKFESYFGRKIAIDASMSIYQFLVWILILAQHSICAFEPVFMCRYAGFKCNVFFELYAVDCSGTKWDWNAHKWGWWNY